MHFASFPRVLYASPISLFLIDLIILNMRDEEYKWWNSTLCNFLQSPLPFFLLAPDNISTWLLSQFIITHIYTSECLTTQILFCACGWNPWPKGLSNAGRVLNTQTTSMFNVWSGVLLERHMLAQVFKNLRGVCESRMFVTVLVAARYISSNYLIVYQLKLKLGRFGQ